MRELFILAFHLLVTFLKLLRPGGLRAGVAESDMPSTYVRSMPKPTIRRVNTSMTTSTQ